ncbi:MAG: LysR family transcriptional activator of nhaA [Lentisphaeria bacterium]|jgi:LysR family transcriptional activator of nhaA
MSPLNYNHLYYFYVVATEGSIAKASTRLSLTPQTISGQLTSFEHHIGKVLFERTGKKLRLSELGQLIYSYAEEIFQLGDEIKHILKTEQPTRWQAFTVGIADVMPKSLAYTLLRPVLTMAEPIRLICQEGDQESLLADLAVNKLDCVLTDQALPKGSHIKAYSHELAESGVTFFAAKPLSQVCIKSFPASLASQPFLLQGRNSDIRNGLMAWLEKHDLPVNIVAEFDDSALMKSFGQAGCGIFTGPTIIEDIIVSQYKVNIVGRTDDIKERYFALSPERRIKHPCVIEIIKAIKMD